MLYESTAATVLGASGNGTGGAIQGNPGNTILNTIGSGGGLPPTGHFSGIIMNSHDVLQRLVTPHAVMMLSTGDTDDQAQSAALVHVLEGEYQYSEAPE